MVRIAGYDVPTPLLVGGIAGVGVLVLGQRLTGQAPTEPAPAPGGVDTGDLAAPAGVGDLWGDTGLGGPAFPAANGGSGTWWDPSVPEPQPGPAAPVAPALVTPPPINTPGTALAGPMSPPPPPVSKPAGAAGYAVILAGTSYYKVTGSGQKAVADSAGQAGSTATRWIGPPIMAFTRSLQPVRLRRITYASGVWAPIWIPDSVRVWT